MHKYYLLLIGVSLPFLTFGKVQISELTPCNYSSFINTDNYNFSGFIEFYNDGDSTDLKVCVLTHYKKKKKSDVYELKWQWTVDKRCQLPSKEYSVLWMDEADTENHAPYKLDKDGGYVTIYRDGVLLDSIAYGALAANVSYGRKNGDEGYMEITPFKENSDAYSTVSTRCKIPVFSEKGGVKTSPVTVSISCSTKDAKVYYTLNGDEPTLENATLYESPIEISENTPLRAKAFADGMLSSKAVSSTYIFPDEAHSECGGFTVPIVSLVMDSAYFYDDSIGICVEGKNGISGDKHCQAVGNYNQDWKRPVNFEYIVDGNSLFSQDVEAEVVGGCSRAEFIKSLSLKASSKSGADEIGYNFFNSKPDLTHKTIHLRNGGTAYSKVRFRDGLMQTFAEGMNIDCQANQPVAYYINGQYQGLMSLNERMNADYITANYGYTDEEIDLISVSDVKGVQASKGDLSAYNELVEYLTTHREDSLLFDGACKRMDMDEYIDYQIFQQFIVNTDWPGNNTKIWREKKNGKFRWILFDTDFGFGLPGFESLGESDKNMISWCAGTSKKLHWANEQSWMTEIFASLYQNKEFKSRFVTKYLLRLSSTFSQENIKAVFDSITTVVDAEYCAYSGGESAVEAASAMQDFALKRGKDIYKQLVTYVEGTSLINFSIASDVEGAVFVVNGVTMSGYNTKYIADYDLNVKVYPPLGYEFAGWTFDDKDLVSIKSDSIYSCANKSGELNAILLGDVSMTANFVKLDDFVPTVVLNEICSSSDSLSGFADDYGSYPDWIELYNYGETPLDLAGYELCLLKSNGKKKMSTLPFGSSSTLINPGEHKVLWAKGDSLFGSLYLNFKIDMNDKPAICLVKDGNELDCVNVLKHATNESYGRSKDNDADWTVFSICDNGKMTSSPGSANGKIVCQNADVEDYLTFENQVNVYPNPTSDFIVVSSLQTILSVNVYDMTGRLIKSVEPNNERCELNLSDCHSGMYYLYAQTNDGVSRLKIQKK